MKILFLTMVLLLCGCSDYVGSGDDFVCPACKSPSATVVSDGDNTHNGFHFYCFTCGTKSGKQTSFAEAMETWKLSPKESFHD